MGFYQQKGLAGVMHLVIEGIH